MIIPIRCFTCNKLIANLHEEYKQLLLDGLSQKEALDKVGMKRMCCRRMFLGHVGISELLLKFEAPKR